jgi:hypothetical protein
MMVLWVLRDLRVLKGFRVMMVQQDLRVFKVMMVQWVLLEMMVLLVQWVLKVPLEMMVRWALKDLQVPKALQGQVVVVQELWRRFGRWGLRCGTRAQRSKDPWIRTVGNWY